jgi:poly-gamma-glutamate synthesis protein (capsule biosynthesis protein)
MADIFGFWRYPSDLDPDQWHKLVNDIYWYYKSAKPIIKPEKNSELEAYFAEKRRQNWRPLLPEGFQGETSVKISAVGDLMKPMGIENSEGKFYEKVAELIFDADISIANLESSLTGAKIAKSEWTIQSTRKQFNALKGHNGKQYTVFCTANNHILDRGIEGFNTTHDQLEAEGFLYVGTNRSPEFKGKSLILTSNGVKFGFVAATYSLNNKPFPDGKDYFVNVIPFHRFEGHVDVSLLENQISYCRSSDCDFIMLFLHWGLEFEFFPRKDQVDIAHHLIEYGADAIISHHTHNIQPFEFYQTQRDPHRIAPIFYSLGNLSSLWSAPYNALSLVTNFGVTKGHVNGTPKTLVGHVKVTPVLQIEYDCNKAPCLKIEKLSDLIKKVRGECRREYLNEAGQYADLVFGKSWRN